MGHGKGIKVEDHDHGWRAMMERVREIKGAKVKVGVLADDKRGGLHHKDPDTGKASPLTLAEIAAVLEWGTKDGHIPGRPALGATFDKEREALSAMGKRLMGEVLLGKMTTDRALGLMGLYLANAVKAEIVRGIAPPNAPSTALAKARKGKTKGIMRRKARDIGTAIAQAGVLAAVKPWIDSGAVLRAFTWALDNAKGHGGHEQ